MTVLSGSLCSLGYGLHRNLTYSFKSINIIDTHRLTCATTVQCRGGMEHTKIVVNIRVLKNSFPGSTSLPDFHGCDSSV